MAEESGAAGSKPETLELQALMRLIAVVYDGNVSAFALDFDYKRQRVERWIHRMSSPSPQIWLEICEKLGIKLEQFRLPGVGSVCVGGEYVSPDDDEEAAQVIGILKAINPGKYALALDTDHLLVNGRRFRDDTGEDE